MPCQRHLSLRSLLLYGQLYYIPFYLLSVKSPPIRAGVCLFPVFLSLILAPVTVGALITRVNNFRWAIWSGWAITTLGTGLTLIWDVNTSTAVWAIILKVLGIGHGLLLNAQNFATQAICLAKDEASAAAIYAFMRSIRMAISVGIGG
jgi:hypothetical protein